MIKVYPITPVPKPRQTRSDKWKQRPAVMRYRAFKDEMRLRGVTLPESNYHLIVVLPMPDSWKDEKKAKYNGQPHQRTPDKDNCEKAVLDGLFKDDSAVWDGRVTKFWGYHAAIIVRETDEKVSHLSQFGDFDCMKK